jgi:Terminase large subunit, T4likevirus-type, N-terminal
MIHLQALPSQEKFLKCVARKKGFSGPVGSGKTVALCYQALISAARNPNCTGLIGAPTYPMLFDVTLKSMLEILEEKGIAFSYHKSQKILTLPQSNSTILFRSLDRYENLRGPNLAWVGVDELTYCAPEAWQILEARVRDPRAKQPQMFAVWTPKGYDWVYRRFISPKDRLPEHEAVIARARENVAILAKHPDFYEQLKSSYDELQYRQEALGEYLNVFAGRVYYAYSDANERIDLRFVPQEGLCWALDFNVDPMTAIIAQSINGRIHVLEEIYLRNSNTVEMCEQFEQRAISYLREYQAVNGGRPLPISVYGDATGQARSTSSKSDYDLIKEYFRSRAQFRLKFENPSHNPSVKDRVNSVNAMLKSAGDQIRTYVHPSCKELITDFLEVSWKQGPIKYDLDKVSDKKRTHVSDAFGYLVWAVAPINAFHREVITS